MQRKAIPIGRSSLHLRNVTALSSIWVPLSISSQRCTPLPFNAMFPSSITSRCDSSSFYPHKPLNRRAFATSSVAADLKKNTVTLTQRAVQKIKQLATKHASPIMLRAQVDGGGCGGMSYRFQVDDQSAQAGDRIFEQEGVKLVVDDVSLKYLGGSTIDWVDSLAKSSFQIVSNPHAASSCGCHTSFTPKEEDY